MEQTIEKKTSKVPFAIIAIITLIFSVGYFVGLGSFIAAAAPTGISLAQFIEVLYMNGGIIIACVIALIVIMIMLRNKREIWAKVLIWGILLLCVLASANFFGNLTQIAAASFTQGLAFVARYAPYLAVTVASVAMIAQWDNGEHKAANMVSFVCMLIAAVMAIFQIKNIVDTIQQNLNLISEMQTQFLAQYVMIVSSAFVLIMVNVVYFYATISRRNFDCTVIGMTDEEAQIVERIERRVDEIADEVEALAAEGEAIIEAEIELEAVEEAAEEAVEAELEEEEK